MKILHVVPGLNDVGNGIAVAARLVAEGQRAAGQEVERIDTADFVHRSPLPLTSYGEVWVHSMWLPATIKACRQVLKAGVPLVRMTHANLDPLRLHSKGWKKLPIWYLVERPLMNRSSRVVATCAAEAEWNRAAGVVASQEVVDLKAYFKFAVPRPCLCAKELHVLYLGRRHPLKGLEFLERAVEALNRTDVSDRSVRTDVSNTSVQLRVVGDHTGAELESDWTWCDVLCLPTLSENFGLVVAEALERGKAVITTDGAPVWKGQSGVVYLEGYRTGTPGKRVDLLRAAIQSVCGGVSCYNNP